MSFPLPMDVLSTSKCEHSFNQCAYKENTNKGAQISNGASLQVHMVALPAFSWVACTTNMPVLMWQARFHTNKHSYKYLCKYICPAIHRRLCRASLIFFTFFTSLYVFCIQYIFCLISFHPVFIFWCMSQL